MLFLVRTWTVNSMKVANNYKNEKKENKPRFARLTAFLFQICYSMIILVLK